MKNTFGNTLTLTLFGESHGASIGAVLDGLAPGIEIREDYIREKLQKRAPFGSISTARREPDSFMFESGIYRGHTTGAPLCITIPNIQADSKEYEDIRGKARPAHADYPAHIRYKGFEDLNGGGHFSGRITAPLVAAGAILQLSLEQKGILIATHLKSCASVSDRSFNLSALSDDINALSLNSFPVLAPDAGEKMKKAILEAKTNGDSVGGILETMVVGLPAGVGEPWFDSVESLLSHGLFSIPGIKGVEFGDGFDIAALWGSQSNDPYYIENNQIKTRTNHQGGIGGGLTNGMPLCFRCAVKPTPSIGKKQETVDYLKHEAVHLQIKGRHDPCIAPRVRAVVDAITAFTLADLLTSCLGRDWLVKE